MGRVSVAFLRHLALSLVWPTTDMPPDDLLRPDNNSRLVLDNNSLLVLVQDVSSNGSHGVVAQRGGQITIAECGVDANALSGVTCIHKGSVVRVAGGNVGGSRLGVYAAAEGDVYLDIEAIVEGNTEANEGCVDGGRVMRAQKPARDSVIARPLSAKNR